MLKTNTHTHIILFQVTRIQVSHYLLPPRLHIIRKLELEAGVADIPSGISNVAPTACPKTPRKEDT